MKLITSIILSFLLLGCTSSSSEDIRPDFIENEGNQVDEVEQTDDEGQTDDSNTNISEGWSIPVEEVLDGGPGKDGIPALVNPELVGKNEVTYIDDSSLVIGFKNRDDIRAYPHGILDYHEIINDNLQEISIAITYCPLTGTALGWNRQIREQETTFGVSGLLYKTNLIPYDRDTGSNWSQLLNECVQGSRIGRKIELFMLVETTWAAWKKLYPSTKVISEETGYSRPYGLPAYGDYATNNDFFLFPVPKDDRLPFKERVHAILDGANAKVYRFRNVNNIIRDSFEGLDYLIVGNSDFIVSFQLDSSTSELVFEFVEGEGEVILVDDQGTKWNIFGEAISGPQIGERLKPSRSLMAYWFSIPAFYTTQIYF